MKIDLRYGRSGLEVEFGEEPGITVFQTKDMPALKDPAGELNRCFERPIGTPPLRDIASGAGTACVVVSDVTRPVPNACILPSLLGSLAEVGIEVEQTRLLVATGIHRAPTEDELVEILGEEILETYPVLSHDARDSSSITRMGYTSSGIPIDVNRTYAESDVRVVTSLVEPHFMAGYSGGRKSVAIGLTSVESIKHLHGTGLLEHPEARNCVLAGNPLHRELVEIVKVVGVDFAVNAVVDAQRRVCGLFCGDILESHNAACGFAEDYCVIHSKDSFDIVITTAAGYPLDSTYYQAVKGLVGALDILSPNGGIILASQCSKGLGSPEFREVLTMLRETEDYGRFLEHISTPGNFVIDQWEVEMLVKALRRGKIFLCSEGISEADRPLTFAETVASVEEGLMRAVAEARPDPRIAVIPEGPYVIPVADRRFGGCVAPLGRRD